MRHHQLPAMDSCALTPEYLAQQDAVLISTDHDDVDYSLIAEHASLVIDTRNAMASVRNARARICKA
jgi:UDP-N-acetyl-D-glucosamine dehydrogenase